MFAFAFKFTWKVAGHSEQKDPIMSCQDKDFRSLRLFVKTTNPQRNTHPQNKCVCVTERREEWKPIERW